MKSYRTTQLGSAHLKCALSFVVLGQLPRKSNSRRIFRNRSTGRPMIVKSEDALNYEKSFTFQVNDISRNLFNGGMVSLTAKIYYSSNRPDLSDELLCDMLEKTGIIQNDRQIVEKHLWKRIDRDRPRVEIMLESVIQECEACHKEQDNHGLEGTVEGIPVEKAVEK